MYIYDKVSGGTYLKRKGEPDSIMKGSRIQEHVSSSWVCEP